MEKVLVTGAAGFIGAKVAEFLLERGDHVVGIDNMNDYYDTDMKEYRKSLLEKYAHFQFEVLDIENYNLLRALFKKNNFRTVFNLAARAGVRYSIENPWIYLRTNAEGTLNLLECMREFGTQKIVLASTSSLYAGLPMPFNENSAVNQPISPYAASKKAAEVLAYTYHVQYKIDVSILRYFTVFGPLGRPDMAPYRFVKSVLEETPFVLFGDGNQKRDFTFVDDIAAGTLLAEKKLGYEIINIGGGNEPVTINEFIGWIEALVGKKALIDRKPMHPADMLETHADISKAKSLLGWEPKVSPYEGLKRMMVDTSLFRFKI